MDDRPDEGPVRSRNPCYAILLLPPGTRSIAQVGAGRGNWQFAEVAAFEGFSHIDCCLITENLVLFVEGKRTEAVSSSTRWFTQRSQLWRNVEAAKEFAARKEFAVVLAVEDEDHGREALTAADATLEVNLRADTSRQSPGVK